MPCWPMAALVNRIPTLARFTTKFCTTMAPVSLTVKDNCGQTTVSTTGPPVFDTPNTVWFNDGTGLFSDSGQRLGLTDSRAVAVGDVDGDGFLDAVVC